jgi:hypothetical protein
MLAPMGGSPALAEILGAGGAPADPVPSLVVAGQQPAVAGGPLYGLLKACHALAEAERLTTAGEPHRALFWVASEDHDLGEAGSVALLRRDGALARIRCDLGGGRASLRFRPAAAWWEPTLAACRHHLGPGLGAAWLATQAPRSDEGMGAWTCRALSALLPGLLVVEGHRLRPLWTAQARALTLGWPADDLWSVRRSVTMAGGADALGPLDTPPWFADLPAGRRALTPAEALDLLDRDPAALSPGAAIRPVLQQAALPCTAFIAGPGERAYHALIGPLYAVAGVPLPRLVPRVSATVLPGWWRRATERPLGPDPLADAIAELAPGIARLRRHADPATAAALAGATAALDRAARARRRHRRLGQPARGALAAWERPRGRPQDRTLTLVQAVWQWGPGIAAELRAACRDAIPGAEIRLPV